MPSPTACFAAPVVVRGRIRHAVHAHPRKRPFVCALKEPTAAAIPPVRRLGIGSSILFETDSYVAVNKPAGLLVHRTKLDRTRVESRYLVNELRAALAPPDGEPVAVFPVHRLDRSTSGVMLFALHTSSNASLLQSALQSPPTRKEYWALAAGAGMEHSWTNLFPLKDLTGADRRQRSACTEFEQLLWLPEPEVSVVRARLRTGRRHQLRRHLSNSRFPILGDTNYARGKLNRFVREAFGVTRCCLHSRRLAFDDPFAGKRVTVEAPVPEDLLHVLRRLPGYDPAVHDDIVDVA